jgi:hypothetical protein
MAFIKPSRPQYDPKDDLRSSGQFYSVCSGVIELDPDPKYNSRKGRLAIEFTVVDPRFPHLRGKKTASVVGASVYKDPKTGKESKLVQIARMMGVVDPLKGFDPDVFLDKYYYVSCELHEGKAFPTIITPASAPSPEGARTHKPTHPVDADVLPPTEDIPS